jgi:hypothetical protein
MTEPDNNLRQLQISVHAITRRLDRMFDTFRGVMLAFERLLAEVNDSGMAEVTKIVALAPSFTRPATTVSPLKDESGRANSPEVGTCQVYATWLVNGVLRQRWLTRKEAIELLARNRFDLTLDETADLLTVNTSDESSHTLLYPMAPNLKGMLWLVLTNAGVPLRFDTIAERLGYGSIDVGPRDNRIHRTRNRFNKMLGGLSDRMFSLGKNRAYPVRREGWSFCWFRQAKDPEQSTLLREIQDRLVS